MPRTTKVILLADRRFCHIELLKVATQLGWHFRIRLKSDTWVYLAEGNRCQVRTLMPPVGKGRCYAPIWLTKQKVGTIHLAIAQVITPNGTEKWAIVSDEPVGRHTFDEYGLRFNIEENFLDDKSAGVGANMPWLRANGYSPFCGYHPILTQTLP